jgi:fructan beta-fructosidase
MHWLHATSKDLLHWDELGIALAPDELGLIFSGSVVVDEGNTVGFGEGALVAMYTSHGECEQQSIAAALDGVNFVKYKGNPVIPNPGLKDFRDPKLFKNPVLGGWGCAIASGDRVAFYHSADLKHWERTGDFGSVENRLGTVFECPDLIPLTAPGGREIWVLIASMIQTPGEGGNRTQYFLGEFDGHTFRQTVPMPEPALLDAGYDNYASVSFFGADRPTILGWGTSWVYAHEEPTTDYCGCMTLARTLSLRDTPTGLRLCQWPVIPALLGETAIGDGGALPGEVFALKIRADGAFSVSFENSTGESFAFGLDEGGRFYTDRSKAGEDGFSPLYASLLFQQTEAARLADGTVEMLVVFDRSICELFADNGLYANATLVYPTAPYATLRLTGASATIAKF